VAVHRLSKPASLSDSKTEPGETALFKAPPRLAADSKDQVVQVQLNVLVEASDTMGQVMPPEVVPPTPRGAAVRSEVHGEVLAAGTAEILNREVPDLHKALDEVPAVADPTVGLAAALVAAAAVVRTVVVVAVEEVVEVVVEVVKTLKRSSFLTKKGGNGAALFVLNFG
jgi:hypothetical protein